MLKSLGSITFDKARDLPHPENQNEDNIIRSSTTFSRKKAEQN